MNNKTLDLIMGQMEAWASAVSHLAVAITNIRDPVVRASMTGKPIDQTASLEVGQRLKRTPIANAFNYLHDAGDRLNTA